MIQEGKTQDPTINCPLQILCEDHYEQCIQEVTMRTLYDVLPIY
jgi:hypothetical protein